MLKQDTTLEFLNLVTSRIGPANATGLLKDAHIQAFLTLFKELGVSEQHFQEVLDVKLKEIAQNIKKMPVPSPFKQPQ